MRLNLNESLRTFIDRMRGNSCRAVYILRCVDYIRGNNIDINEYYEGINNDRIEGSQSRRES